MDSQVFPVFRDHLDPVDHPDLPETAERGVPLALMDHQAPRD